MSLCSVGLYMNRGCNKLTYSRTVGVNYLESFDRDELELTFLEIRFDYIEYQCNHMSSP